MSWRNVLTVLILVALALSVGALGGWLHAERPGPAPALSTECDLRFNCLECHKP